MDSRSVGLVPAAVARLMPTEGNHVAGTVRFREAPGGLQVEARVRGLPAGAHAFHVHLLGDCSGKGAKSAGPHFNFGGPSQGPAASIDRITGNLGELITAADGTAASASFAPVARLDGSFSILGRSVVVHARGNDPTTPDGAAGARLACGVIGIDRSDS